MKDGGSLNGGSLAPEHYRDYADYLVRAVQAYAEEGCGSASSPCRTSRCWRPATRAPR
ncbi:hypothetical protein ACFQXA_01085 [Nocardiopsis composta]